MGQSLIDLAESTAADAVHAADPAERSRLKARAEALLKSLENARVECKRQLDAINKPDAMELVTGKSAIDQAIEATRLVIKRMEHTSVPAHSGTSA